MPVPHIFSLGLFLFVSKRMLQKTTGWPPMCLPEELLLRFGLHVQDTLGEPAEHQVPIHLHHAVGQFIPL